VKALLLAAGLGTRLRPLTNTVPKCLVPIHGRPLLDYWLELLIEGGIESVLVNTHYLEAKVRDYVRASRWESRVSFAHEERLLGTGGTVLRNRAFFANRPFLVGHADNLTRFDVQAFMRRHAARPPGTAITMMTFLTDSPQTCGIVVEDRAGMVREYHEKSPSPPGNLANAAVYIFDPEVVDFLESLGREVIDLSTEVLPHYVGRICTFRNSGYHRDIGSAESLEKAQLEYR
jgi:mannose-1-phosphate guanylyltransferase